MSLSPKAQWRTCVLFSHARPILRGRGTSVPIFLGTFYTLAHSVRNSNQILHGDQTILEENFTGSTTPTVWPKMTGMLTRDLFALANLLVYSSARHVG